MYVFSAQSFPNKVHLYSQNKQQQKSKWSFVSLPKKVPDLSDFEIESV